LGPSCHSYVGAYMSPFFLPVIILCGLFWAALRFLPSAIFHNKPVSSKPFSMMPPKLVAFCSSITGVTKKGRRMTVFRRWAAAAGFARPAPSSCFFYTLSRPHPSFFSLAVLFPCPTSPSTADPFPTPTTPLPPCVPWQGRRTFASSFGLFFAPSFSVPSPFVLLKGFYRRPNCPPVV